MTNDCMPLSIAIAQFLRQFEILETQYVGLVLRALTGDVSLIDQAQSRLQLQALLTPLMRMAMGRAADVESNRILGVCSAAKVAYSILIQRRFAIAASDRGDFNCARRSN